MNKRITLLASCLALAFGLAAQDRILASGNYDYTEHPEAAAAYEKGNEAFKRNDHAQAVEHFRTAARYDSLFVEAYDNLGLSFRRLNMLDSAEHYYRRSIAIHPEGRLAHQNLAVVHEKRGDIQQAMDEYVICTRLAPGDPEGYYGASRMCLQLKDAKNGLKLALKAEELYKASNSPIIVDAQYLVGISNYMLGDTKAARKYLQLAKNGGVSVPDPLVKELKLK